MNTDLDLAFPGPDQTDRHDLIHEGMTLRDYFAAKAMQSLVVVVDASLPYGSVATDAYRYADAMLEARNG